MLFCKKEKNWVQKSESMMTNMASNSVSMFQGTYSKYGKKFK